ncbi:MAG: hypothetical protein ACYC7D_15110 [Nitrososphaerales archaeon]
MWKITDAGLAHVNKELDKWEPEYSNIQLASKRAINSSQTSPETPEEAIEFQFQRMNEVLAFELLTCRVHEFMSHFVARVYVTLFDDFVLNSCPKI